MLCILLNSNFFTLIYFILYLPFGKLCPKKFFHVNFTVVFLLPHAVFALANIVPSLNRTIFHPFLLLKYLLTVYNIIKFHKNYPSPKGDIYMIRHKQLNLKDILEDCQNYFVENKLLFLSLLICRPPFINFFRSLSIKSSLKSI